MKKEKIEAMRDDYKRKHLELSQTKKRVQAFNHNEQLARYEGMIFALTMIIGEWDWPDNENIIEQ